ncbi:hypothetical protein FPV67DRAFT_782790 [Lyophyllum atratum]|nr:hypothetical protein FPV67DRAFT_782790 [Lyophyllum atratum]
MFLNSRVGWAIARPRNILNVRTSATTSNLDASPRKGATTRRLPRIQRVLGTLDPQRIQPQDFIDVSDYRRPCVKFRSQSGTLRYASVPTSRGSLSAPFPPKSHGFLYYHHDPKLPPTTGEIRLRLAPHNDPVFQNGEDLKAVDGSPWAISLLRMTKAYYEPFRIQLLEEGLLDSNLMRVIQEGLSRNYFHPHGTYIHYLGHPFPLDIAHFNHVVRIFTPQKLGVMAIAGMFNDKRKENTEGMVPYSGRILVRFERSTLPQHAGSRFLVLRVLDILEPIKVVCPGYDMHLPIPKKGTLVEKYSWGPHPGPAPRPWSINLDRPAKTWKDIGLLYPEYEKQESKSQLRLD